MNNRILPFISSLALAFLLGCGGGGGGAAESPPSPPDTTPNAFNFAAQSDVTLASQVTSSDIVVSGINAATTITISGGEYSIDGGPFTAAAGVANNNQHIKVRLTAANQFSTSSNVVLTVGGVSATFTVKTAGKDTTPDAFVFAEQTGVNLSTTVLSNAVTVAGINSDAPLTIAGGEYSLNGTAFTSQAGTVSNGQVIKVRVASSTEFATASTATLTIGGVAVAFKATTLEKDTTPDAFQFPRKGNVVRGAWGTSSAATITGINAPAAISIQNGEYALDGGAFTSAAGLVNSGQVLVVRVKASSLYSKVTQARVTVGSVFADFEVTSEVPNFVPDKIDYDGNNVIYLLNVANKLVFRWSVSDARYLESYSIGTSSQAPTLMSYSSDQQRLYFGYSTGAIKYIDVTSTNPTEAAFANTPLGVAGLASVGKYVMAQDYSGAWATHYVFDRTGALTDQKEWNYYSREYAWDAINSRVYFFRDNMSPDDLHYEVIDQGTGKIASAGETPYHGSYNIQPPIRVSASGNYVLLGSGDIYREADLTWSGSLGSQVIDARWLANGSLISLTGTTNQTTLRRLSSGSLNNLEQLTYSGQPLRVVGSDTKMTVIAVKNNALQFYSYVPNDDSDGDGVPNTQDAFPLDAAASVDTDRDGYPDAWNPGKTQSDSTTGLTLDAYPQDSACYLLSHGDGVHCNYGATIPNYVPDQIANDGDIIYLLSAANKRIYRWSISTATYLNPYIVGINQGFSTLAPTLMTYSSNHHRLYLGYSTGAIHYIDLTASGATEVPFSATALAVSGLASVGNYVLAQDYSGAWATHYTFDRNGAVTDQKEWNYYSPDYAWDAGSSRVYFFAGALTYEVIDQGTGKIGAATALPYLTNNAAQPPIRVSTDSQYVLIGNGDLFKESDSSRSGALGSQITDARWLANGSVIALQTANNQTALRRFNATLNKLEQLTFNGQALRVVGTDAKMAVVAINNGTVQFHIYVPNNDSDGDGVPNTQDAFPLDAAASIDSDHDGYPDAWNLGKTQSDSTTGLVLDAYPHDAACYLLSHGNGVQCNYASTVPNYIPDQIVSEGDTIYLLSSANKRVYRWSITTGAYINPYVVGIDQGFGILAPTKIAYSTSHQRLYLGYSTGAIQYIDTTSNSGVEAPFANISSAVNGLAAVGQYLLAPNFIFDRNGVVTDSNGGSYYSNYSSRDYAWDAVTSRVYYFRDGLSPNDLLYQVIDQATGHVTSSDETPYHGSYNIDPPIRVSINGQYILLGSGDIYNQSGLTWSGSLGTTVTDARWFANGSLVALTTLNNQTTLRRLGGSHLSSLEQLTYSGQALRVVGSDAKMAVVVVKNGTVQFYSYVPNDDSDGDGVPNTQDAFPLDAAASVDTDGDGYPDAWNSGKHQSDSTTGLTLDAYPQDSACYLLAHGDGVHCNYSATIPNYTPDQVINQGDTVYLLSSVNKRVYRWSIATGSYMNPYIIGINQGFSTLTPTKMTFSSDQQRLYFGYSTGAIQYIDVTSNSTTEVPFGNTALAVGGLAAVGKFIMAQDASGAWATHYVFDRNGAITDQKEWNYYSREYAWDAVNSRVYFFRDDQSPDDLHYEVVDQITGKITSAGETPYHGDYQIQPPIRVSPDGQSILLGSGDIYMQADLKWSASIAQVKDAHWKDNVLVDLDNNDQVEIRDKNSLAVLKSYQYLGQPVAIVFGQTDVYLIHVVNNQTSFLKLAFGDQDQDGLPKWWEQLYGLSDTNAADALGDLDGDGVNNLAEYQNNTNPLSADSDSDGLTDYQEIHTYFTNPNKVDTDGDGLSDKDEVLVYHTDPTKLDTDGDGYDDRIEILDGGNPNDATVLPQPLNSFSESFESSPLSPAWSLSGQNNSAWALDSTNAHTGAKSMKSGPIGNLQYSSIKFRRFFPAGQLQFYSKTDLAQSCCARLYLYIDGDAVLSVNPDTQWNLTTAPITPGIHDLEWRFQRDYIVYQSPSIAWLDDVVFVKQ